MGWYATVSMNATSAVWRVSHSNGLSICCHQYRCSIHWYYPEVAFFFFYHISLILFYFTSCLPWFYFMLIMSSLILLFFFSPSCPAWFHFLTIMSSLILFSVHHVQPDFIFVHHVQPGFIFCSSCPAWSPHIMPSQGAQTTLGTTPCQPLSSLSSQSQPKDLFPCILACTPTHKIFHQYHNTHPHPAHDGLTHTAGQINDPIQVC